MSLDNRGDATRVRPADVLAKCNPDSSGSPVELPYVELSHEDELVQSLLEPVERGGADEGPLLLNPPVPDGKPKLALLVEDGPAFDEPVLGFVPGRLCPEPPEELLEAPELPLEAKLLLPELSTAVPDSSLDVDARSEAAADEESPEVELNSSDDKSLDSVADSALVGEEL